MKERIEQIRKALDLKQYEFAEKLGVTNTAVCAWESGRRNVTDQVIKSICREFNVNYLWLTEGLGDMFVNLPETIIDELCLEYELDEIDRNLILEYVKLDKGSKQILKDYMRNVFTNI